MRPPVPAHKLPSTVEAACRRTDTREYVLERLFPADGNGDQAWQELKALLGERIADGLAGKVSARSIAQIADEELDGDDRA